MARIVVVQKIKIEISRELIFANFPIIFAKTNCRETDKNSQNLRKLIPAKINSLKLAVKNYIKCKTLIYFKIVL